MVIFVLHNKLSVMKRLTILLVVLMWLPLASFAQNNLSQEDISNIESYIEQIRTDWQIPGMGVSIQKDGEILLCKGFGVKNLDNPQDKVDPHTLFQIGSVTKSFTAYLLATLVEEGLISWENTVKEILPDFQLYDPWVTEHLQVKDLTSHKTGIGRQVGTYIANLGYDRNDIYSMMSLIKPAYTFRGAYQYNNITFIPAAKIIEKVTGKSWEDNIRERIFEPLGMNESTINGEGFAEAQNVALPYEFISKEGKMVINPLYGEEQALWWLTVIGPAGSICCPPTDLIKWAQFQLDGGKVGDKQLISKENMDYLHRGVTITSQSESKTTLYGHCWFIEQSKKGRIYFHTGTTWGMTTLCVFVPEFNLALTVQVNSEAPAEPRYAMMRRLVDLCLDLEDYDYNADFLKEWYANATKKSEEEAKAAAEKVVEPAPDPKLITGIYTKDPLFGDARVTFEEDKLYITIGKQGWKHEMAHVSGNTYKFRSDGTAFEITFKFEEGHRKAASFEVDFKQGEEFGPWTRLSK